VIEDNVFLICTDLIQVFGTVEAIINALRSRFDGLLIHYMCYYQSYHPMALQDFIHSTNRSSIQRRVLRSESDLIESGKQQDCLGMTPLHILACSTVHHIEIYRFMIGQYPETLIMEDAWGALPLLYAIWGSAPSEIVQLLVNSYQSLFPNHQFNWSRMVETLGRANAPLAAIQNLLYVQHTLSSEQTIDWSNILRELAGDVSTTNIKTFCFLTSCSIEERVKAIGVKCWRDSMASQLMGSGCVYHHKQNWLTGIHSNLAFYESEYQKLKEAASVLELAIWKAKMHDSRTGEERQEVNNKKLKMDESEFRLQCRISCGADHIIENVLPYLLPPE
jgi:hypothetical protein